MRAFLLALLLLGAACQTKPKTTEAANQADTMAVDLNKMPSREAPRSAADRIVRAIYFEHDKADNPFLTPNNTALAEQYFTKPTAALVQAKAAKLGRAKRHALNPLYNVPDGQIEKMWVLPANVAGDTAVVFVTYVNTATGKEQAMRCEMTQIAKGRWRVADIVYADGKRLTDVLK
jgi:hypothetical protein